MAHTVCHIKGTIVFDFLFFSSSLTCKDPFLNQPIISKKEKFNFRNINNRLIHKRDQIILSFI